MRGSDRLRVEPFLAIGNEHELFFKGRVIKAYKQRRPSSRKSWIENIIASIKRYSGSKVAYAKVEIKFQDMIYIVETDEEGVFEFHLKNVPPVNERQERVRFRIVEPTSVKGNLKVKLTVERFYGEHGVISDIDDTIIISHAISIMKKFWLSISKNAYSRRPLPGVSKFYRQLTQDQKYPVFYVSSSDWSLFDLIQDFISFREIPSGPLLLKDKHINLRNIWKSGGGDHSHKFDKISFLLTMYPGMSFVLVGDSGQHDPEIYLQVIQKFPGRIKDVFIRLVKEMDPSRKQLIEEQAGDVKFHFIENVEEAMEEIDQLNAVSSGG